MLGEAQLAVQLQGGRIIFDDFEMKFAWKAYKKGYNSGFYVRSGRNVGANQIDLEQSTCGNLLGYPKGVGPGVPGQ